MSSAPIVVQGVGKRYVKYQDAPLLITALRVRARTRRSQFWALRDASFTVEAGESLGVIGRNGSGKSTLLRLLAGVTAPTEGSVLVRGRVAPLISVGVGFHPELTGRENVYVNGTVLGLSRRQIEDRFDEIVDFAELPEFIDTPVKFYSSGMFVRLGFAVAASAEPSVLLVDEVLAVGDIGFQLKCFERMRQLQAAGTTIVVVSHNLGAVRLLCPRTLVLHDGDVRFDGPTDGAIEMFHALLARRGEEGDAASPPTADGQFSTIEEFELNRPDGTPTLNFAAGDEVTFRLTVRFERDVVNPVFGLAIFTPAGVHVYGETSPWAGAGGFRKGERAHLDVHMAPQLASGSYTAQGGVRIVEEAREQSVSTAPLAFYVTGRPGVNGIADLGARMSLARDEEHAQRRASQNEW